MSELAILFIHRGVELSGYSASNFASAKRSTPYAEVIPLSFDKDDVGGDVNPQIPRQCWWSPDRLVYHWFRRVNPTHKRFLICEDDTYFNQDPEDFFGTTWNADAVGGVLVNGNLDGLYHEGHGTHEYWIDVEVFRSNLEAHRAELRGFISMFGLFSHRALSKMSQLYFDTPWLVWDNKRRASNPEKETQAWGPNAECLLATLANLSGYDPVSFAPTTRQAAKYIWPAPETTPDGPGIWHPVKRVLS